MLFGKDITMKTTMRAQVVVKPGVMELREVPVPEISDDEVLIKIKYCGVCGSDWSIFTGKYVPERLPLITGHEFFGTVAKMGKNAVGIAEGERVAADIVVNCGTCYFCRRGDGLLCQSFGQIGIHTKETSGGFSEYVKVPWKNVYKVPDVVDDYKAAFIEPITACLQACRRMDAPIASSVVVMGAGLGLLHGALARLRGAAPVIVVGSNQKRLDIARAMCADYIVNYRETPDVVAEVMRLTNGIGADCVIESVGTPKTYEQAFRMVRRGGKVEAFGICGEADMMSLSPFQFVLHEKKVSGSCAGIGNDWGDAITLLQYGRIDPTPLISLVAPLEELEPAMRELQENKSMVKVLISPEITRRIEFK